MTTVRSVLLMDGWMDGGVVSHLMCRHLALGALAGLQAFAERRLDRLHLGGNGLQRLLVVLLSLQGFIQTLLLLAYLGMRQKNVKNAVYAQLLFKSGRHNRTTFLRVSQDLCRSSRLAVPVSKDGS